MSAFEELGVLPEIIQSIEELGWQLPTSIQSEAVPLILGGGDVMAAAETGSGKTGAFSLPILQVVHETLRELASGPTKAAQVDLKNITLSPMDKDPVVTLDDSNLICRNQNSQDWGGIRATIGLLKGKYYFEAKISSGLPRIGWATKAAKLDIGIDRQSFGFGGTGKKSHNRTFLDYGKPYGPNDVVGSYIDLEEGFIGYTLNGTDFGRAFEIPQNMLGYAFYPAITMKGGEASLNFGQKPFINKPASYKGVTEVTVEQSSASGTAPARKARSPLSLIVEPVRELAEQTHNAINSFLKYLPPPKIGTALLTGGAQTDIQLQKLKGADIVTGTPGRLLSLIESGALDLTEIKFFVLDEADKLLEHIDTILKLYDQLPKMRLQVLMFSATLHSSEILALSEKICRFPTWVDLKGKDYVPETVHHAMVVVDPTKYLQKLDTKNGPQTDGIHRKDQITLPPKTPESHSEAVKLLKPIILKELIDAYKMDQALIFVRTRVDADNLERFLRGSSGKKGPLEAEYSCAVLAGNRSDDDRRGNLNAFREGQIRFLICTDVAARGIDIKELPYVINITLPDKPEDYIHRVGRVGRADNLGLAISLVSSVPEKVWYHQCPSRGANCHDTRPLESGGCSIWYNEPTFIKDIESRIGDTVEQLPDNYKSSRNEQVTYGQKKDKKEHVDTRFKEHKDVINNEVAELNLLEIDVQKSFLSAKKWNNIAKKH